MTNDITFISVLFGVIFLGIAIMLAPTLYRDWKARKQ